VIIGGGFGGLDAARGFAHASVRVTLIDRHNYHLFQPLLYQVATASLSPGDIASPIRWILRKQKNVQVLLAEARAIDAPGRSVILDRGELTYDYLIVATGSAHSYFGHTEWEPRAPGLKTLDDALEIRRQVLLAFEAAEREPDEARQRRLLTFVIVGGGPTGVKAGGALRSRVSRCRRTSAASTRVRRASFCSKADRPSCRSFRRRCGPPRSRPSSASASRSGPVRSSPAWTIPGWWSRDRPDRRLPRRRCCGRPASRHHRSRNRSTSRSIASAG
jgi:hypothetical protein